MKTMITLTWHRNDGKTITMQVASWEDADLMRDSLEYIGGRVDATPND